MKVSFSRSTILLALAALIVLAAMPSVIRRLIETRDPYLFTRQFFEDMLARLSGPGRFRFILQPTVAVFLGIRDGVKDARSGHAPFLSALITQKKDRSALLRSGFASIRDLIALAIILDLISQFLILRRIHPAAALILGPVLITFPYSFSRALANRIARKRGQQTSMVPRA
jgi:hypothetical protein